MLHSLIIGVDHYHDSRIPVLLGASSDASRLAHRIRFELGSNVNIVCIIDAEATKASILEGLESIANELDPGDRFLFYFAGHGCAKKSQLRASVKAYLAPHDVSLDDIEGSALEVHLDLPEIIEPIRSVAESALVILDTCFVSGGAPNTRSFIVDASLALKGFMAPGEQPRPFEAIISRGACPAALLAATEPGAASFEDPLAKCGIFTKHMLEAFDALVEQGPVRVTDLVAKLAAPVRAKTMTMQRPTISMWTAPIDFSFPSRHDV